MAKTQYSLRVVKQFTYRGALQEFSNRYHFDGGEPTDWTSLFDAVTALEKNIFTTDVTIVAAHGYGPANDAPLANKSYALAGTLSTSGSSAAPGDCALVLRQATTKLSTKHHVVYVFSYFHGVRIVNSATDGDTPLTSQKNAVKALGDAWLAGITGGARTYKRTTPDGALVTGALAEPYIGHRDFPR
jgi:hypothetical protein